MRFFLSGLMTVILFFSLTGCYVMQQAGPFLSQRMKARDIQKIMDEPGTDKTTRLFLSQVLEIKDYALRELGLAEDKNFTRYIEVEQDYVATVVSACEPLSFETYYWSYPFLGKMPYKGFYKEEQARKEVARLKKKGKDVWARRVEAFSSLGYFTDPLYSYMKNYTLYDLANLIIHEQVHATVFFKNQSQFNEELASFIGDLGARFYVISLYGGESEEYRDIDRGKEDSENFVEIVLEIRKHLEELYSRAGLSPGEMTRKKGEILREEQKRFLREYSLHFHSDRYRSFADLEINNAYLDMFHLYYQDNSLYRELYETCGSIPEMIRFLKPLEKEKDPKKAIRDHLASISREAF